MKPIVTLMVALFSVVVLSAQNGQISGKIVLNHNAEPAAGAELVLQGTAHKVVSETNGTYLIEGIIRGNYNLEVSYPGIREKKIINLNVDTNQKVVLNFEFCYNQHTVKECPVDEKSGGVISIVYGSPSAKELKKIAKRAARKSDVAKTDCSPNYYCTKHQLEF